MVNIWRRLFERKGKVTSQTMYRYLNWCGKEHSLERNHVDALIGMERKGHKIRRCLNWSGKEREGNFTNHVDA